MIEPNNDPKVAGTDANNTDPKATTKTEVKTVTVTHKQVGIGIGTILGVALLAAWAYHGFPFPGDSDKAKIIAQNQQMLEFVKKLGDPKPAGNQQIAAAPASDPLGNRPWFEVGGRMPNTETQTLAKAQGYAVEKGKPNDSGCKIVDTPQGKVNRCPNSWVKR